MSVSLETLERIKAQLKQARDQGSTVKLDLYTHLTEVFNRIMLHHPYDAYDKFEEISHLVKQTHLKIKDPKFDYDVNSIQHEQANPQKEAWIKKCQNLLKEVVDQLSKEDRALLTKNKTFIMPNVQEEARLFEWAGVSFGEEETYKLSKAMKRLATLSGASRLRFWGKVLGIQRDYWVIEGILDSAEEDRAHWSHEKRGEGVNKLVYWVNDNLLEDWIQLPDSTPEHIKASRLIKHVCTGNLNATIDSNPPFPGKERHFLRAQIARITHGTYIVPKDMIVIDEETKEDKFADEFAWPEDLKNTEIWVHGHPMILQAGRTTHVLAPDTPEEGKDEALNGLNEKDPASERYSKAIKEDVPVAGIPLQGEDTGFSWIGKVCGDTQPYNNLGKEGTTSYAVNIIKSLRWPGALTVAQSGKFANIYVGYGLKKGDTCFNPIEPPEIMKDPVDQVEQPEPTPLHPKEQEPEPDTDADKKKAEGDEGAE